MALLKLNKDRFFRMLNYAGKTFIVSPRNMLHMFIRDKLHKTMFPIKVAPYISIDTGSATAPTYSGIYEYCITFYSSERREHSPPCNLIWQFFDSTWQQIDITEGDAVTLSFYETADPPTGDRFVYPDGIYQADEVAIWRRANTWDDFYLVEKIAILDLQSGGTYWDAGTSSGQYEDKKEDLTILNLGISLSSTGNGNFQNYDTTNLVVAEVSSPLGKLPINGFGCLAPFRNRLALAFTHSTNSTNESSTISIDHGERAFKLSSELGTTVEQSEYLDNKEILIGSKRKLYTTRYFEGVDTGRSKIYGASNPGTMAQSNVPSVGGAGGTAWVNVDNAKASDDSYASVSGPFDKTKYLDASNFDLPSIPINRKIVGIEVKIEKNIGAGLNAYDYELYLVKAGSKVGDNKADTVTVWSATDTIATYGGSTDLWGTAWTRDEINASTFGVSISAKEIGGGSQFVYVDHITIKIYTETIAGGEFYTEYEGDQDADLSNGAWEVLPRTSRVHFSYSGNDNMGYYSPLFYVDVNPDDGDYITNLIPVFGDLLVVKTKQSYILYGAGFVDPTNVSTETPFMNFEWRPMGSFGTRSPEGIDIREGREVFGWADKAGLWSWDGSEHHFLMQEQNADRILNLVDWDNSTEAIVSVVEGQKRVYVFNIRAKDSELMNNFAIAYDYANRRFEVLKGFSVSNVLR